MTSSPLLQALMVTSVALIGVAAAVAADGKPVTDAASAAWRVILGQQVKKAKGCDLNEVLSANEIQVGDAHVLEGRLSCVDGREFTFTRRQEHQGFEFELCEPTFC